MRTSIHVNVASGELCHDTVSGSVDVEVFGLTQIQRYYVCSLFHGAQRIICTIRVRSKGWDIGLNTSSDSYTTAITSLGIGKM
jgi:hypothetical protein